ncbi:carboxymuconolactone decarboxylase family protein [Stappia taiwanensis]|uniref:Alkyl hydroperoxide reductase AhpD n=1 Tax=Stappia taiwanensis TaxID=992267 RepID=A0A838XMW0_9HYPH|nr:carboxymuconolactone decarboxylase family protein [Stappia taiwanensis]MBA4611482.1 carboxymuconolactone decarboxylase family protein [Stappia taiwanensis]GGE99929.1 alkyl hydroperoxide reductase AhpD [Stappia taiwanensis]
MSIENLKNALPDFAKDTRLNLSSLASDETFTAQQKYGLLVACAIACRNETVRAELIEEAAPHLSAEALSAAKAAAVIMAQNNVYYRFVHLASNAQYKTMPAKLRMNVIGKPGVDKLDFELWSLAVSAINGCGMCIDAHEDILRKGGLGADQVQAAIRYAAIIQSAAVALEAGAA